MYKVRSSLDLEKHLTVNDALKTNILGKILLAGVREAPMLDSIRHLLVLSAGERTLGIRYTGAV